MNPGTDTTTVTRTLWLTVTAIPGPRNLMDWASLVGTVTITPGLHIKIVCRSSQCLDMHHSTTIPRILLIHLTRYLLHYQQGLNISPQADQFRQCRIRT